MKIIDLMKRTLREIKVLKFLNHENIVRIRDMFPRVQSKAVQSFYIVMDYMESDLMQILNVN